MTRDGLPVGIGTRRASRQRPPAARDRRGVRTGAGFATGRRYSDPTRADGFQKHWQTRPQQQGRNPDADPHIGKRCERNLPGFAAGSGRRRLYADRGTPPIPTRCGKSSTSNALPIQKASGTPGKCAEVNLAQRYAILKDINGIAQYLLIPTERIFRYRKSSRHRHHASRLLGRRVGRAGVTSTNPLDRTLPADPRRPGNQFPVPALAAAVAYPHRLHARATSSMRWRGIGTMRKTYGPGTRWTAIATG